MIAAAIAAVALSAPACAEDQACWNWATMGNRHRGVTLTTGQRRVVGPCAYRRLRLAGRIATVTPRLRGDATAVRKGCRS